MNKKFNITALGEILIDFTVLDTNSSAKLFQQNPGGAPANVLVAATKLGCSTAFIGKAGNDMHGLFLKDVLIKEKINTSNFLLDDNVFTTLAFVDIDSNKERTFSFARKPGADTLLSINEVDLNIIKNSNVLHVGSLSLTHEPVRTTTHEVIKYAKENNIIVSYDPNYRASLWSSVEDAIYHMRSITPDIMKISDEETLLLTGVSNYEEAAIVLFNRGIKIVVVTLGDKGSYVYNKEGGKLIPSFKSNLVDTTGAGDAFWGAFLSKVNNNLDVSLEVLSDYALFANATASLCVEQIGAIPAMPSIDDVLNRIKK